VRGIQLLYRFDFNEKTFINEEIDSECRFEAHPLKLDVYRSLPCHVVTQTGQLTRQHHFVDALEKTGT